MTIPQIQTQPIPLSRRTEKRCNDWRITKANRQEKTNSNPYNLIPAILPHPQKTQPNQKIPSPGGGGLGWGRPPVQPAQHRPHPAQPTPAL